MRLGAKSAFLAGLLAGYGGLAVTILKVFSAVSRGQRLELMGVPLQEEEAPALWALVREIAVLAGTRAPDSLQVIPAVNAAVAEDTRLLGLRGGRRHLFIGAPLLIGLSVNQLRSCLAHELAHYSSRDSRLGPVTYRGREALLRTLQRVAPTSIIGVVIRQYAGLYFRLEGALGRGQEFAADRLSARLAGAPSAADCLRGLERPRGGPAPRPVGSPALRGEHAGIRPRDFRPTRAGAPRGHSYNCRACE